MTLFTQHSLDNIIKDLESRHGWAEREGKPSARRTVRKPTVSTVHGFSISQCLTWGHTLPEQLQEVTHHGGNHKAWLPLPSIGNSKGESLLFSFWVVSQVFLKPGESEPHSEVFLIQSFFFLFYECQTYNTFLFHFYSNPPPISFIFHMYCLQLICYGRCFQRWQVRTSVWFSHSFMSDSFRPHESHNARPPCPSKTPGVYSNSCPSSRWCHPAISSSVVPFSSCPHSLLASGSFPMSQLFSSGGQSIGVSASKWVLPMNTQDWSPLGWTGWISLQSKGLSRVFSNTTVQKHQFFSTQLSSQSNSHIHTWPLEKP